MRNKTQIFSVFGQIEAVAAQIMIDKGEATHIPPEQIPDSAAVNDLGQRARFAVVVPREKIARFETLIADLRA